MIKVMRSHGSNTDIVVSIDARSWEGASSAIMHCYRYQPKGYGLISAKISRRGKKGGRRCQAMFVLRHVNSSFPEITSEEADSLFSKEVFLAGDKPDQV